jgi:DNA invertase Pin-like site-specific DNA recombinase
MSRDLAIQPRHLARTAIVYVRQSTAKQLVLHQESTRRQYQLTETAARLGWPQPRIVVIDDDLGLSGASSSARTGFQRLVAAISLGEVGIVLVTEISRLSRLSSDWHRVIELCAVFETLIADEDGLYDPRDPNDRLVLGLKGTLFSAELHILHARMRGGLLNKARRGALALRLPVGYRRVADGSVVQDPDEQVRTTLHTLFDRFALLGNARAVQRAFIEEGLLLPRYLQCGPDAGRLVWVPPTYQMISQILISPVYAGTFVYGRRVQRVRPGDPSRTILHRLPQEEWDIVVPDVYPAYITAAQYHANRETLRANMYNFTHRRVGAAREGPGLLVGIVHCGRCGRRMSPSYSTRAPVYHCRREQLTFAVPQCQSFPMPYLDDAVTAAFFAAVQPAQLATLLTALERLEQERQRREQQWQLRLERARYATRLAERQYDAVDPANRLVARTLETRWNDALVGQERLERDYAAAQQTDLAPLTEAEQQAVRQLAGDLPAVWAAATTTPADRKRLLRLVLQAVTVTVQPTRPRSATVAILWSGGTTTEQTVTCRPMGWHCTTAAAVIEQIRCLAQQLPDHQIAERLNAAGVRTHTGQVWTYARVASMRKQHQIPTACPLDPAARRERGDGFVPVALAAQQLGVSRSLLHIWIQQGVLTGEQRVCQSYRWVRLTEADRARLGGQHDWSQFPPVRQVMREQGASRADIWARVRAGAYRAYRHPIGQRWEWRLQALPSAPASSTPPPTLGASPLGAGGWRSMISSVNQ